MSNVDETNLPEGWCWAKLQDVATVRLGRQRSPKNHSGDQMRHYLRAGNVTWSGLKLDDVKKMNFTDSEAETYRLQSGDIVLGEASGSASEVGKPAIWKNEIPDCCFQNTLIRVRVCAEINPHYLLQFLRFEAIRGAFAGQSRGVGIRHIGAARLSAWSIPIPPKDEQQRVVDALEEQMSRLDVGEQSLGRAATMVRRFSDILLDITRDARVSPGQPSAPPPRPAGTDDGPLRPLPASWSWMRLEEIAEVVGGVTKDQKKQSDLCHPEVPYLRVANVQRGRLDLAEIATIRVPETKVAQLMLQPGDVLLNEGGDRDKLGRGWVWEGQIVGAIHQNHVFRARVRDEVIHPKLLSWYANSAAHWFEVNGKQSVNLASISLSKIKQLPVPVPPRDEQDALLARIEDHLSLLTNATMLIKRGVARAAHLRQALLARAFVGRLVPQDPNDEPASVVLDRIRLEREAARGNGGPKRTQRSARFARGDKGPPPPATVEGGIEDGIQQELPI